MVRESMRLRRADRQGASLRPIDSAPVTQYDSALRSDYVYTPPPLDFNETFLQSDNVGYDSALLTYDPTTIIAQNPYLSPYGAPTAYVIVRSPAGYPVTSLDGYQVSKHDFTGGNPVPADQRVLVTDSGLTSGRFYYYGLFARYSYLGNTYWLRIGISEILVPMNFGYQDRMWTMVPEYYRRLDEENKGSAQKGTLRKFIDTLGYEVDIQRTWALTVGDLWDTDRINSRLLMYLAGVLGVTEVEEVVGDKRFRKLLNNIMYLRKLRGTSDGIEGYMSAVTGYKTIVYVGKNLYLSNDDSEMRASVGLWESGTTNVNQTRVAGSAGETGGPVNATDFFIRHTNATGAGATAILRYGPSSFDRLKAIPVTAAHQYRSSFMAKHSEAAKAIVPLFDWYKVDGTFISTTTDSSINISTSWASYASTWVTAPALSAYCVPRFSSASMSNAATLAFWRMMFTDRSWVPTGIPTQEGIDPTTAYETARKVWINVYPQRTNFAINSDFRNNGAGWSASDPATYELLPVAYATYTAVVSGETTYADLLAGYNSFTTQTALTFDTANGWLVVDTSATTAPWLTQTTSAYFPVIENVPYGARLEAMSAAGANTKLLLRMKWYTDDISSAEIGTPSASPFFSLSTTSWTTCTIGNVTPPPGARFGRLIIETSNPSNDHIDRIRRVIIEDAAVPGPYFDGTFTDGAIGDFRFTGANWTTFSVYSMSFNSVLNALSSSGRALTLAPTLVPPDRDVGLNTILNGLLG